LIDRESDRRDQKVASLGEACSLFFGGFKLVPFRAGTITSKVALSMVTKSTGVGRGKGGAKQGA
jgi:hypothetical protein